jgi:hypothetical protein
MCILFFKSQTEKSSKTKIREDKENIDDDKEMKVKHA